MYAGQVVESGPVREVLAPPAPPLHDGPAQRLPRSRCATRWQAGADRRRPPDLREPPAGLPLRAALPVRPAAPAASTPPLDEPATAPSRRPAGARRGRHACANSRMGAQRHGSARRAFATSSKHFPVTRTLGEVVARRAAGRARASTASSFDVGDGEAVGHRSANRAAARPPSGRLLLKLVEPTGGAITFAGAPIAGLAGERAARLPPPGAARLPEPVRRAQPALHHLPRRSSSR